MRKHTAVACLLVAASGSLALRAEPVPEPVELRSTLADQLGVAVTIYNADLALIKDRRKLDLPKGPARVALREVSAQMRPETALLRATQGSPLRLLEQNFEFDLLTPARLLEKYVGGTVRVARTNPATGEETVETAQVLAAGDGVVLRIGDRIETQAPGRIIYDAVPANLRDRPTLVMDLESPHAGTREVELAYLSGGLSWRADYVAELAPDEKSLDLAGWVTLTNASGASYRDARLQLVAGDLHLVQDMAPTRKAMAMMSMAEGGAQMREESLLDYHLYTLQRPTTLAENQTKQVGLLTAGGVAAQKVYLTRGDGGWYQGRYGDDGTTAQPVAVMLSFENREPALGMPLPAGVVRVYKRDQDGDMQFVGEDRIAHTPRDEALRLTLGNAFDITARRAQMEFAEQSGAQDRLRTVTAAYRVTLRNATSAPVTVRVQEPLPGDWRILTESATHAKLAAGLVQWEVPVAARGEAVLEYRVSIRL